MEKNRGEFPNMMDDATHEPALQRLQHKDLFLFMKKKKKK